MPEKTKTYRIYRDGDDVKADLLCNRCGNWFTVPADDPLFTALIVSVAPRFACGKCENIGYYSVGPDAKKR